MAVAFIGQIGFVQSAYVSATSQAIAVSASVAASSKVVVFVGGYGVAAPSSVTDSAGNTYSQASTKVVTNAGAHLWYSDTAYALATSDTITVHWASAPNGHIGFIAAAWSGVATGAPLATNGVSATGTTCASSLATSGASGNLNAYAHGWMVTQSVAITTVGQTKINSTSGYGEICADYAISTGGSTADDHTTAANGQYSACTWARWGPSTATAPAAPTIGTATPTSSTTETLTWTANGNGGSAITGYEIWRSTSGGAETQLVANTGTTATTYYDTGLTSATVYYYKVKAINAIGSSSLSGECSGTTIAAVTGTGASSFKFSDSATGTEKFTGTGAASFKWSETAAASVANPVAGTSAASFKFSDSATGAEKIIGASAASFKFSETSAASVANPVAGTSAASFKFSGTATGGANSGTGASSFGWSGAASGLEKITGTGASAFGWSETARAGSNGASAFGWSQTAAGLEEITGTSAASFKFSDTAAGSEQIAGTSAAGFKFSSVASGAETFASTGAVGFTFSTVASGVWGTLGTSAAGFKSSASASGLETLTGASASGWPWSSTISGLVGQPVTGTSAGIFTWSGAASGGLTEAGTGASAFTFSDSAAGWVPIHGTSASGWPSAPAGVVSVANPVTGRTFYDPQVLVFPGPSGDHGGSGATNILGGPYYDPIGTVITVHVSTVIHDGNIGASGDSPSWNTWQSGTVGDHTFTVASSPYWIYSYGYDPTKSGAGYMYVAGSGYVPVPYGWKWFNIPSTSAGTEEITGTAASYFGHKWIFNGVTGPWTMIGTATMNGPLLSTPAVAGIGAMVAFTDPAADFTLRIRLSGVMDRTVELGLAALDAAGTGVTVNVRLDTFLRSITTYSSETPQVVVSSGSHPWVELRRVGSNWSARSSDDGSTWSSWCTAYSDGRTITQLGVLQPYNAGFVSTVSFQLWIGGVSAAEWGQGSEWSTQAGGVTYATMGAAAAAFKFAPAATGVYAITFIGGPGASGFKASVAAGPGLVGFTGTAAQAWRWKGPVFSGTELITGTGSTAGGWGAKPLGLPRTIAQYSDDEDRIKDFFWPHRRDHLQR